MSVEIEAKLKVDSLAKVEHRLIELGAEFVAEQLQTDSLLDDCNETLLSTDRCLRIRQEAVAGEERCFLCYKSGRQDSSFKKRQEIETEVKDAESLGKLLSALGYEVKLVVEKKRRLWKYGGCEVALDELPLLGDFVEIEGPNDDSISNVQTSLGLANVRHVPKSYAHLIKEQCGRRDV